jgi:DNA-binding winged helix-turn-helix (wHTH) protein/Flp pilus assembly protein TadD
LGTERICEFGCFRLLMQERVLLRDGQPILLTPKTMEMLLILVENHGHVVRKDTLMQRIWPDTFVQEDNITYNISVLRKTLACGTSGEQYIETVPKNGYRFIASVRTLHSGAEGEISATNPPVAVSQSTIDAAEQLHPRIPREQTEGYPEFSDASRIGRRNWRMRTSLTLVVVLALTSVALVFRIRQQNAHALTSQDTVVLADFTNDTGEAVFDESLKQALRTNLEQSPFLTVLSDHRVSQELRFMGMKGDERLATEVGRDVCQRAGGKGLLIGSISRLGKHYVVGLQAVDCQIGDSIGSELSEADSSERVLASLGDAATKMRAKLGESLSSVKRYATPIEEATTPSLDALKAYSSGRERQEVEGDDAAAAPFFRRAISLDRNFAMAYAMLGACYSNLEEPSLAAENARKAYELREHVSEPEKFYIDSHYYDLATGERERARQAYDVWAQTYPQDFEPTYNLGVIDSNLGRYEKTLEETREALRLDPASAQGYGNVVAAYLALNRLEEARITADEAQVKNLDSPFMHSLLYQLAFLQNDAAGMARQEAWAAGKPGVEDVLQAGQADTAAYSGSLGKARELSRQAVASAERADEKETAAGYEAEAALREALFGNAPKARQRSAAALALSADRDVQYGAALALALAGNASLAQKLAEDLGKRFPEDTLVRYNYLPTIHAQLSLSRNDTSKAIEALQAAAPYELGDVGGYCALYPVYLRGKAYLASHQGSEAAAEFEKILRHRGVVWNEPIGALARLGLARAYALQGESVKARAAYNDFLTLWKEADPGIPILLEAKAEYAKVK